MRVLFQLCTIPLVLTCSLRVEDAATAESSSVKGESTRGQSQFFQEILTGRCYARPPTGKASDDVQCPSIVGEITSVVANTLDKDITATSFQPYLGGADFSSPKDGAIFLSPDESVDNDAFLMLATFASSPSSSLMTPETTPGGALMADLVFCGVDVRDTAENCRTSQARLSFWKGVYAQFAARVQGRLRILLPKDDDKVGQEWFQSLMLEAGIQNLNATSITSVVIYSPKSTCVESKQVSQVKEALTSAGIAAESVTCTQNALSLVCMEGSKDAACQCLSDPTTASSTNEPGDVKGNSTESIPNTTTTTTTTKSSQEVQKLKATAARQPHHRRPFTLFFFLIVVPLAGGYILYAKRMNRTVAAYDRVHDVPC